MNAFTIILINMTIWVQKEIL